MPVSEFIGHVNLHWQGAGWLVFPRSYESLAKDFAEKVAASDAVVVLEYGTDEGHPHFHYWVKTGRSKNTFLTGLKSVFASDLPAAVSPPAQWFSCKVANQAKLATYFQYLAKGPHSEHGVPPQVRCDFFFFLC